MRKTGILFLVGILFSISCGDGKESEDPVRIGKPGTIFEGPSGGRDRYLFPDGSSVNFVVSGTMTLTTPKGIFKGTAFPADVSYSVRSANGGLIEGAVSFPRIIINNDGLFEGNFSSGATVAVIAGLYTSDTTTATIDVQGFSASIPTTDTSVKSRTVYLQAQLNATNLETR